ncbi:MAG: hypothetical protein WBG42_08595 [Cryomorphaceae bacterium]
MKTNKIAYIGALALALVFAGCSKEYDNPSQTSSPDEGKAITDKEDQAYIDETIDRLPSIAIYNESIDQYILLDLSNAKSGFDFASPSAGFSFSGPGGGFQFVEGPDGNFYQVVTPGSGGGAGGTVTAGNVALDVNYVFCFSSGDELGEVDLFDVGSGFSGFSGAVGIAGDFEALAAMGESDLEDADPFEFFQGFVAYYAFDGTADGSYDIIDFFDAEDESEDFLEGKGLAFLISFQDGGGIFFSTDGEIEFSGSSVSFNGTYWGFTDVEIGFGEETDTDEDDSDYVEVEGFGTLTCQ